MLRFNVSMMAQHLCQAPVEMFSEDMDHILNTVQRHTSILNLNRTKVGHAKFAFSQMFIDLNGIILELSQLLI